MFIISFNAINTKKIHYCPTLHLRNWLLEMLNNMTKVPQISNGKARIQTGIVWLQSPGF